ncbi:MAG: hypothetical protein QXI32_06700, partial [Candidatus Bathyarchaeia archaeon]
MPCWSGELRVLFHVNDEILPRLKQPFGQLVSGPPKNTIPKLREIIHNEKPKKLIAVGDVVARNMQKAGLPV